MTVNDLRNDNDMIWHDRMTYDNLVYAVLATLAAALLDPPPTPYSLSVTEVLFLQHFYPQEQLDILETLPKTA